MRFSVNKFDPSQVYAGRDWSDVVRYFRDFDFLVELSDAELTSMYEEHQVSSNARSALLPNKRPFSR